MLFTKSKLYELNLFKNTKERLISDYNTFLKLSNLSTPFHDSIHIFNNAKKLLYHSYIGYEYTPVDLLLMAAHCDNSEMFSWLKRKDHDKVALCYFSCTKGLYKYVDLNDVDVDIPKSLDIIEFMLHPLRHKSNPLHLGIFNYLMSFENIEEVKEVVRKVGESKTNPEIERWLLKP